MSEWRHSIGIELSDTADAVITEPIETENDESVPWLEEASGQHRLASKTSQVVRLGQEVFDTAITAAAEQIALSTQVISQELEGLDAAGKLGKFNSSSVEISFGISFKGGVGKIIEAVLTAGGETSMQVKIVFQAKDPGSRSP